MNSRDAFGLGDDVTLLLANELLAPGSADEVVVMATAQQERYMCVLPKSPNSYGEEEVCEREREREREQMYR